MTPPGNDVLYEMIRSIKEEQIPALRREITNGLLLISEQNKIASDRLALLDSRITILENYKVGQVGQLGVWKWLISVLGISTVVQWLVTLSDKT